MTQIYYNFFSVSAFAILSSLLLSSTAFSIPNGKQEIDDNDLSSPHRPAPGAGTRVRIGSSLIIIEGAEHTSSNPQGTPASFNTAGKPAAADAEQVFPLLSLPPAVLGAAVSFLPQEDRLSVQCVSTQTWRIGKQHAYFRVPLNRSRKFSEGPFKNLEVKGLFPDVIHLASDQRLRGSLTIWVDSMPSEKEVIAFLEQNPELSLTLGLPTSCGETSTAAAATSSIIRASTLRAHPQVTVLFAADLWRDELAREGSIVEEKIGTLTKTQIQDLDPEAVLSPCFLDLKTRQIVEDMLRTCEGGSETADLLKQLKKESPESRGNLISLIPQFLDGIDYDAEDDAEDGADVYQIIKGLRNTPPEKRAELCGYFTPDILKICGDGWEVEDIMRELNKVPSTEWKEICGYLTPALLANCGSDRDLGQHGGYDVAHFIIWLKNESPERRQELASQLEACRNFDEMSGLVTRKGQERGASYEDPDSGDDTP